MLPLPQGHLTLNPALLGECAMNCRAYAKASTTCKELEFHKGPNTKIMESLIIRSGEWCAVEGGRGE